MGGKDERGKQGKILFRIKGVSFLCRKRCGNGVMPSVAAIFRRVERKRPLCVQS